MFVGVKWNCECGYSFNHEYLPVSNVSIAGTASPNSKKRRYLPLHSRWLSTHDRSRQVSYVQAFGLSRASLDSDSNFVGRLGYSGSVLCRAASILTTENLCQAVKYATKSLMGTGENSTSPGSLVLWLSYFDRIMATNPPPVARSTSRDLSAEIVRLSIRIAFGSSGSIEPS
jgi:hypothetical protein